jgi:hypothetical protein
MPVFWRSVTGKIIDNVYKRFVYVDKVSLKIADNIIGGYRENSTRFANKNISIKNII